MLFRSALAFGDAIVTGDIGKLAANVGAALIAGFAVGVITGNPVTGMMAFNIALNFHMGKIIGDFALKHAKGFEKVEALQEEISAIIASDDDKAEIKRIVLRTEFMFGAYSSAKKKLAMIYGTETGKLILDGLEIGLDEIDELGAREARDLLNAIYEELDMHSPSREAIKIGKNLIAGLDIGLAKIDDVGTNAASNLMEAINGELGIHSASTEGIETGDNLMEGLLIGIENGEISILTAFKQLIEMVKDLWDKSKIPAVVTTLTVSVKIGRASCRERV